MKQHIFQLKMSGWFPLTMNLKLTERPLTPDLSPGGGEGGVSPGEGEGSVNSTGGIHFIFCLDGTFQIPKPCSHAS